MDSSPSLALCESAVPVADVVERAADACMRLTLCALPCGVTGKVANVLLGGSLGDRLVELGFTNDAPVRVLRRAPFGGPLQLQIREFVLSLRRDQALSIVVVVPRDDAAADA